MAGSSRDQFSITTIKNNRGHPTQTNDELKCPQKGARSLMQLYCTSVLPLTYGTLSRKL